MSRQWLLACVAASASYLLVTGHPQSWLAGLPLRPFALSVAVLGGVVLWALWPSGPARERGRIPSARLGGLWRVAAVAMCGLVLLKAGVGYVSLTAGLPGWYFDNSRFQGTPEQSTDFLGEPWTRREREVGFGGDEFPTYFLNDVQRFNFFGAEADRRRKLPFSVRWEGVLYVPVDGSYTLWLTASGPGMLRLDGHQIAAVDADGRDTAEVHLDLPRGSHDLRATYARRPQRSPDFKVEWDLGGVRQPVAVPYLFPGLDRAVGVAARSSCSRLGKVLDGLFLALDGLVALGLIVGFAGRFRAASSEWWRLLERPLLGVWLAAIFINAIVPRLDRVDKLTLLGGGQDWLTHESFARDILLNGPLMTLGKPLGEGRTFYAQPFYPYALAAMHCAHG